jgi:hypothetical protein
MASSGVISKKEEFIPIKEIRQLKKGIRVKSCLDGSNSINLWYIGTISYLDQDYVNGTYLGIKRDDHIGGSAPDGHWEAIACQYNLDFIRIIKPKERNWDK